MSDFALYLRLGLEHISDLKAYDHILFVVALCAGYPLGQWRRILILITAFTIGHSFSLALSVLDIVRISTPLVEFLIPITILITAIGNVITKSARPNPRQVGISYGLALFFGLIHGLGFSNYLRQLLSAEQSLFTPLLGFNLGLEVGQLIIVTTFALLSGLTVYIINVPQRDWKVFVSGAAAGISLILIVQSQFW